MKCQDTRCQSKYPAKYFIRAAYDRIFVCGYHARMWAKSVRIPIAEFANRH